MMSELDQPTSRALLAIDEASEAQRAARVEQDAVSVVQGLLQHISDLLFTTCGCIHALRPGVEAWLLSAHSLHQAKRPRITYHLNDAMDNGLTKWQASEMLMQLALCRLAKRFFRDSGGQNCF